MDQKARRKQLVSEYKQARPEAGVYRIVNSQNGKVLLGSSPNLPSVQSKMEFARTTNAATIFGYKMAPDIRKFGIDAFSLEILEVLEIRPEMTQAEILAELKTLEALWREQQAPSLLY
jgi:hypothetical protein